MLAQSMCGRLGRVAPAGRCDVGRRRQGMEGAGRDWQAAGRDWQGADREWQGIAGNGASVAGATQTGKNRLEIKDGADA